MIVPVGHSMYWAIYRMGYGKQGKQQQMSQTKYYI